MRGQEQHLLGGAVAGLCGLARGDLGADADVAEHAGRRGVIRRAGAQFIHGEAHDVGRAGQVQPTHVQVLHRLGLDEDDVDFRVGADVHLVEHVVGQRGKLGFVDLVVGLVDDLGHDVYSLRAVLWLRVRARRAAFRSSKRW